MAKKLSVQIVGAPLKKDLEAGTVAELKSQLDQQGDVSVIVNQRAASDEQELVDGDFIVITQNIKGANWEANEAAPVKAETEYVWQSPTLVIMKLADGFRVNGQKISSKQLEELNVAILDAIVE